MIRKLGQRASEFAINNYKIRTDARLVSMAKKLALSLVNLIYEAALKSFWRKTTLRRFLRLQGVSEKFLSSCGDESKRETLDRLFAKLPSVNKGQGLILSMGRDLAQQTEFPDLRGWEDSEEKIEQAEQAVAALRSALAKLDRQEVNERDRHAAQERLRQLQQEARRSQESLANLSDRLQALSISLGTQRAGYEFQDWFFDLMGYFEVVCRRPYTSGGRQIDGSVTISGTTYLVELKFTQGQADANDIDSIYKKVIRKADNTMGILVSISGYSTTAIAEASADRTPLLLLDHGHLYLALGGIMSFAEIVERVRRHASQTGEAYLPAAELGL